MPNPEAIKHQKANKKQRDLETMLNPKVRKPTKDKNTMSSKHVHPTTVWTKRFGRLESMFVVFGFEPHMCWE